MATTDGEHLRFFPYDEPYDHQREAMAQIAGALADDRDVLFEGATGTGKTLAALAPTLEHARAEDKTVVITTNVHQQTRQFIEEARAITRQESIRAVVFRGKASMCHIDVGYEECQALRDTTRDLVETEREIAELERREEQLLTESQAGDDEAAAARSAVMDELTALEEDADEVAAANVCDHYYRNLTADTDAFYAWLYEDVRTPEEIYEYADREGLCGYELLKEGMEGVDLVVCNYHHLLDPFVREQFFRWIGRDPEDVIAVFDEAHNVAPAARDHATRTLAEQTLDGALDELAETSDARADAAANVLAAFRDAMVATYEDDPAAVGAGETWTDVTVAAEAGRDDLTMAFLECYTGPGIHEDLERAVELGAELDTQYERAYKEGETRTRKECRVQTAADFVDAWLAESDAPGQYPVVSVRRTGDDPTADLVGRAELYTCIPRSVTTSLFEDLSAAVLMSATLRPFDVAADVLGLDDPVTMAYGAQFPEARRRTYAVDVPALFASRRDDPEVKARVTRVLEDAARFTPGNVLAFFPSYAEAERYHDRVETGTPYLDEPATPTEELKQRFVADDDGVLFTSLWGTLAEGVSFDDDDARTVVVVGVPYPHLDDRSEAVQDAYEGAFGGEGESDVGWRYAVEIPTVRKTRQALGRVVRSPTDFGARVLVDERYVGSKRSDLGEYSVHGSFPVEERRELIDVAPGKLKGGLLNFYADMDAWDGAPPRP
ncbi:MAG: ATP-dependent DNA helicase [Haloarculaceae archaeon]